MKTLVILLMLTTLANAGINFDMNPRFQDIRKQYIRARNKNYHGRDNMDLYAVEMRMDTLAAAKDAPISRARFAGYLNDLRDAIHAIHNKDLMARVLGLEMHITRMERFNGAKNYSARNSEFIHLALKYLRIIDPVGAVVVATSEPVKTKGE